MKQLLTILFILLLGCQQIYAQTAEKLESFKQKVLPEYGMYFNKAELNGNGQLSLTALEKYIALTDEGKKAIMGKITSEWQETLIVVNYGSTVDLWGKSIESGGVKLLDSWKLNALPLSINPVIKQSKISQHPWFFYVGGMLGGDNQHNVNFTFNSRLGFFLLADKWDFATTLSLGSTENSDVENSSSSWSSFGLMTRWHLPLKKYSSFRPNIGISMQTGNGNSSASLSLGLMWFVGFGSIDVAFNIGDEFTTMGGYTVCPQKKK